MHVVIMTRREFFILVIGNQEIFSERICLLIRQNPRQRCSLLYGTFTGMLKTINAIGYAGSGFFILFEKHFNLVDSSIKSIQVTFHHHNLTILGRVDAFAPTVHCFAIGACWTFTGTFDLAYFASCTSIVTPTKHFDWFWAIFAHI